MAQSTRLLVLCALAILATRTDLLAQTTSLPAPWNAQDIGAPQIPGTVSFEQSAFTLTAAGKDIGGKSDQFYFVYQQVTGDVDVVARVDSVSAVQSWSKSGVMIRSSLDGNSANGYASVSAGRGTTFQSRASIGANTSSVPGSSAGPPQWVRLVRSGNTFTAYTSADGLAWTAISSRTITMGAAAYVGLATTSRSMSTATTAVLSQVALVPLALPSPLKAADVGAPAVAGFTSYRQSVFTVHAGGADIGDAADQFHYVYQQMSGDVDVVARVSSVTLTDPGSRSGVMIRESLTGGARHAYASLAAGDGYAFDRRADTGGMTDHTAGPAGVPPGWVRLVRSGTQIEAFRSQDGTTWQSMGTDAIPMTDSVYVGIATTSHNASKATDALIDSFKATAIVAAPNQAPIVALTAPVNGSTVASGGSVSLTAAASDSDGTVARVDFFSGTTLIGSDTAAPYAATWPSVAPGTYSLTAVATDNDSGRTTSTPVTITAASTANQPPSVTLTAPANGTTFTAPATIALTASASDPENALARVEFYSGTTRLGSDTTAPYSFSWSSVAAGTYSLRAVAYDTAGASATSATATVTVGTGNQPPTVTLTSPANNASFTAPATIAMAATASDPENALARVEFYSGTTLLGTDTSSPYSFSWSSVPAGTYTVRAVAYDTACASASSASSTVTVTTTATTTPPRAVVFQASVDHATLVTRYELRIFASGASPLTATPLATSDLAKPTPDANNDITVDRSTFFSGLATGTYVAAVSAIGSGGASTSTGVTFTR